MLALVPLLFTLFAIPALAGEGVLEISQTCAIQTGCFPGDSAGFPVTIDGSAGHSYLLTSDLVLPNENTDGIAVYADHIGVDLNNFQIIREACIDAVGSCIPSSGTGSGIRAYDHLVRSGIAVSNGSIVGMAFSGILLGRNSNVRNLRVRWSRFDGIFVKDGSMVSDCLSWQNGIDGIDARSNSTVIDNTVTENSNGILVESYSSVIRNTATNNRTVGITGDLGFSRYNVILDNNASSNTIGIRAGSGSTVSRNTVSGNSLTGILSAGTGGTLVSGNSVSANGTNGIFLSDGDSATGNTVTNSGENGISAGEGSNVEGNTTRGNGASSGAGFGILFRLPGTYRENTVLGNTTGPIGGTGVNLGGNYCDGTGTVAETCP